MNKENGHVYDLDVKISNGHAPPLAQPISHQPLPARGPDIPIHIAVAKVASDLVDACRRAMAIGRKAKDRNSPLTKPRVLIVERQLLQYRVAFYKHLRTLLEKEGVEMQLLVGEGTRAEKKKKNETSVDGAIHIPTRYFLGERLCWQPFGAYARAADMVIVMHENKLIYNLWLLSFGRPRRIAFWGHGRNMQSDRPEGLKERFKRWTVNKVDWWFAYTESSAALINAAGFPHTCTTVVENAIDTREMTSLCHQVSQDDCLRMREKMKLGTGPIGLYLGSLYEEKRLDFLLDAAQRIRGAIPDFQLLIVGAGPEQYRIDAAVKHHAWIHYLGPLQDRAKAEALMLADVMLNPGLVGLGILDSFVSGRPMFTTDCGLHSPEISYMKSGYNGVMTANDVEAFASAVSEALQHRDKLAMLRAGALASAQRYTIENMAQRICNGILSCLAMP